ncbi:hypothetical protein HLV39_12440 [Marinobacter adhaerens]|uniref:Tail tape measure protein n=1 Tax=Marinobacter adhaerens TaxID=1033846 RepID=A0A851HU84_9GAMM|nr:hypothetical protein [Marinobacter adhaerens]NWN92300.1 hypothetical protein [Marinobacter adhaerens]
MASKSLGTLTLDLVARTGGFARGMTKAERESKKWRRQVEKDMRKVGKAARRGLLAVSGAALAGGAALTKMAADGLSAVDSQNKVARSLDGTYNSLSALNIAFDEGGVEGYERSLNRMNRRLGAAETGTGAAAKTVEALNLNLSEFSDMDVDERIAAISDAIRESGASAQQAARYAQDLGFEQEAAAQFFMQGGDAIRAYRKEVDDFGLAVSEIDAVKIEQANDEFAKVGRLIQGVSAQLATQVAPILGAVSQMFVQNAKDAGGIGEATADSFNTVIDAVAEGVNALDELNRKFLTSQNAVDVFALNVRIGLLEVAREIVEIPTNAVNEMIMLINNISGVDVDLLGMSDFGKEIQSTISDTKAEIVELNADLQAELDKPLKGTQFKRLVVEARDAADESAAAFLEAQEKIKGAMGGTSGLPGMGGEGEDEGVQDKLDSRLEALRTHFETEKETILRLYGERDEEITELEEARTATKMEADNLRFQNEREKQEAITALYADEANKREKIEADAQRAISSLQNSTIQNAIGLLNVFAGEHKAFALASIAITKAQAIAEATQNTAVAAMKAMTIDPSGFMAAKVEAMGALNVGIIAATGLAQGYQAVSGGGSVGTGGYSSSGTHPPATQPSDPAFSEDLDDDRRGVQINFHGDVNGLDADQISRSIKDHLDSTDFVLVEPASRNGRALRTG